MQTEIDGEVQEPILAGLAVSNRNTLEVQGFVVFSCAAQLPAHESKFAEIEGAFLDLPPDPYGKAKHRYRRYSRATLIPWSRKIEWLPSRRAEDGSETSEYYQGNYNPSFAGKARSFAALGENIRRNRLLDTLIWHDFDRTFWSPEEQDLPKHVGVHFVKLMVDSSVETASASPEHLHQDGEAFTFAHLVGRENVIGGINTIAGPRCVGLLPEDITDRQVRACLELNKPLDSYGVCDQKVSHYLSAVRRGLGMGSGHRSVILIDFTTLVPRI
jgi:hypothetical protein